MALNRQLSRSVFPETADIETSSDDYALRFAGPTGQWLLSVQERITLRLLSRGNGAIQQQSILDVGGGHGQLALPLVHEGYQVTVVGSDDSCQTRLRPLLERPNFKFCVGNLIELPFPAKSFDHVVCFRFISHCDAWPQLVKELCRVARHSVILDYPPLVSWNLLTPVLFHLKKKLEGNTRTYTLFKHHELDSHFQNQGFELEKRKGQFFLPMVVHRKLKQPAISEKLEAPLRNLGVTDLFGSPVIARFNRRTSSANSAS